MATQNIAHLALGHPLEDDLASAASMYEKLCFMNTKLAHLWPERSLDNGLQALHLLLSLVSGLAFGVGGCSGCPLQQPTQRLSALHSQACSAAVRHH